MNRTVLEVAAAHMDKSTVEYLLEIEPKTLNIDRHVSILDEMLCNIEGISADPCLWIEIFDILIANGASLKNITSYPCIPTRLFQYINIGVIRHLLNCGLSVNLTHPPWEQSGMHRALTNADKYVLEYLTYEVGGDIDSENSIGQTLLFVAIETMRYDKVKQLIRLGANPNLEWQGQTTLQRVMIKTRFEVHKMFTYLMHRCTLPIICQTLTYARERMRKNHVLALITYAAIRYQVHNNHPRINEIFHEDLGDYLYQIRDEHYLSHLQWAHSSVVSLKAKKMCNSMSLLDFLIQLMEKNYEVVQIRSVQKYVQAMIPKSFISQSELYGSYIEHQFRKGCSFLLAKKRAKDNLAQMVGLDPNAHHIILQNIIKFLPRYVVKNLSYKT